MAGSDEIENRLLLALAVNLNSSSRRSAPMTIKTSYLRMAGVSTMAASSPIVTWNRPVFSSAACEVQCLIAVSVMLALPAREQEDLGPVGHCSSEPEHEWRQASRNQITLNMTMIRGRLHGRRSSMPVRNSVWVGSVRGRPVAMSRYRFEGLD